MYVIRNELANAKPVVVTQAGGSFELLPATFSEVDTSKGDVTLAGTGSVNIEVNKGNEPVSVTQNGTTLSANIGEAIEVDLATGIATLKVAQAEAAAQTAEEKAAAEAADKAAAAKKVEDDAEAARLAAAGGTTS